MGDEARQPTVGPSQTDMPWTDVRLAITGLQEDIRCEYFMADMPIEAYSYYPLVILIADNLMPGSSPPWGPVSGGNGLFEYISNEWCIIAYNEVRIF